MQIEEAIERLKLCMSMSLHGGEQTIVNIKDLKIVLNYIDTIDHELKIAVKQIKDFEKGIDRLKKQNEKKR